ncbi:MAG: DUF2059 domain-containing protein [Blastocatellia bacterium]|nr:DUF2059 domain-containing protein [Blastocatellia bacterium]
MTSKNTSRIFVATSQAISGSYPFQASSRKQNTMQKFKFGLLFFVAMVTLASGISVFAQQATLTKKQSLILEFRRLTGADRVNMNINLSTEDVRDSLSAIVEKDNELTETQKQELRKAVADAYAPIEKLAKDFFADRDQLNAITEKVVFQLYDTTFSEVELGEAIAYYKSLTGQKTAAFLPTLSAEVQKGFIAVVVPKLQALVQPVSEAATAKLKQKVADIKVKKSAN